MGKAPESALAHQLLDGLSGLEVGPATYNPFGLNTRNVGLRHQGWEQDQLERTGAYTFIHIEATGESIPVADESEDFVLSSHVVEHVPDLVRTLLEWYRIVRPGGYIYIIAPLRDATPTDRLRPVTTWDHLFEDFLRRLGPDDEPETGVFSICHYHVLTLPSLKLCVRQIFGPRVEIAATQERDDKVGNGFTLVLRKVTALEAAWPWSITGGGRTVQVTRQPAPDGYARLEHDGPPWGEVPGASSLELSEVLAFADVRRSATLVASLPPVAVATLPWTGQPSRSPALLAASLPPEVPLLDLSQTAATGQTTDQLLTQAATWAAERGAVWLGVLAADCLARPALFAALQASQERADQWLVAAASCLEGRDANGQPGLTDPLPSAVDGFFFRLDWWRTWWRCFRGYRADGHFWPQAYAAIGACHGRCRMLYDVQALWRLPGSRPHPAQWSEADRANIALYCAYSAPDKAYNMRFQAFVETVRTMRPASMPPAALDRILEERCRLAPKPWEGDARPKVHICLRTTGPLSTLQSQVEAVLVTTTWPYILTVAATNPPAEVRAYLESQLAAGRLGHVLLTGPVDDTAVCHQAILREPRAAYFLFLEFGAPLGPQWLEELLTTTTLATDQVATTALGILLKMSPDPASH